MTGNEVVSQSDSLLHPFLLATDQTESDRHLERLIHEHAEPIIKGILRRRTYVHPSRTENVRQSQDEQDAEDVRGEVVVQLLTRLHRLKSNPGNEGISNLRAYVAVTTYRACDKHLRQRYPQRWRLKSRLRYLLTHQPGFALWQADDGEWWGGFDVWRERQKTSVQSGRLQQLRDHPQTFVQDALRGEDARRMNPADVVAAVFDWVGHPVALDDLVGVIADLQGVRDEPPTSFAGNDDDGNGYVLERVGDQRVNVDVEVDQRAHLQWLWTEIRQLPPRQCAALLLNLRDAQGRGVIALLPLTGVATMRQIANVLSMLPEEFAQLWNDLPLDDETIAQHLGVTRQQVINLRKVARERLLRRTRDLEEGA
jgi:DNA-directed RNA polymerase specialized sigma24 family protein